MVQLTPPIIKILVFFHYSQGLRKLDEHGVFVVHLQAKIWPLVNLCFKGNLSKPTTMGVIKFREFFFWLNGTRVGGTSWGNWDICLLLKMFPRFFFLRVFVWPPRSYFTPYLYLISPLVCLFSEGCQMYLVLGLTSLVFIIINNIIFFSIISVKTTNLPYLASCCSNQLEWCNMRCVKTVREGLKKRII